MGKIYTAYSDAEIKAFVDGYLASGRSLRKFASGVGIPESSLRRWISNDAVELPVRKKKNINVPPYPHVEQALCTFIRESRAPGIGITNSDVKEKAIELVVQLAIPRFSVSNGWITIFKKRNALAYRVPTKRARKAHFTEEDLAAEEEYFLQLGEFIYMHETPTDRVYNFDQTMIRLVSPQPKTISPKGAKEVLVRHPDGEKDGLTIALTIRADGEKQPAIIVFKAGRAGVLSDRIMSGLTAPPNVVIWSGPSTWWTERLDHAYIDHLFPQPGEMKVLVRDQLPVYNLRSSAIKLEERNVVPIKVPPGRTGDYQPLDVGVNKPFKAYYRAEYADWRKEHNEVTGMGYLKKPSRQDFVNMISSAWEKVSPECVRNSFVASRIIAMEGAEGPLIELEGEEQNAAENSAIEVSFFSDSLLADEESDHHEEFGNGLPL